MKHGVVVVNLGTPSDLRLSSVAGYLNEFLTDPRVIDLPWLARQLLVRCIITPTRVIKSRRAYKSIWQSGSPLLTNSQDFVESLSSILGDSYKVVLAMRYGHPSIKQAMDELADCDKLTIFPLYPQYAASSTGTAIAKVFAELNKKWRMPELKIIRDYYDEPLYIEALKEQLSSFMKHNNPDHVLLSYHGLPMRHIEKEGCNKICAKENTPCSSRFTSNCYRGQCYATSRALMFDSEISYTTVFQSRLGRLPWSKPYLVDTLDRLYKTRVRHLAIMCPSFTMDCLETLEEINMGIRELWLSREGTEFSLIPCLNSNQAWVKAAALLIERQNESLGQLPILTGKLA